MLHGELDGFALAGVENLDVFATHFEVRTAVVHESSYEGQAAGVDEVAVVVQDVHVCAHVEAFLAGDDAEGFGVQGAGAADGFFEDAGEEDFGLVLSAICLLAFQFACAQEAVSSYLPTSKAGDAIGDSSVEMVKTPSNLRSADAFTTSDDTRTMTLVLPSCTVATPYSSPKDRSNDRNSSNALPSRRTFSRRAWRRNDFALFDGSASRGILF